MSLSHFTFREAEKSDFDGIEDIFHYQGIERGWTTWKYLKNPDGVARVFVVEDETAAIVGTLAYLPRQFSSPDGGLLRVMLAVDIFVKADLRQQYVFLGLLEFARKNIDGIRLGVPNNNSAIFGAGPGWRIVGPYQCWKYPVLIGNLVTGRHSASVAPLLNWFCKIYQFCWLPRKKSDFAMKQLTRFRTNYAPESAMIQGLRSADFLNWRFIDNPVTQYHAYEFVYLNESIGYCVFTQTRKNLALSDFITLRFRQQCLSLLIDHCRHQGIAWLSYYGAGLALNGLGFIPREHICDCVAYNPPTGRWVVAPCDIDTEPDNAEQALS